MSRATDSFDRVRPAMVTLAREGRGLTQSKLADLIGISQGHLSKIEAGLIPATDQIAERLAVALNYPVEFFALTEPIYGPGTSEFFHRKRQALSSRLLDQLHATINIRRIHVSRLLRAVELDPDAIPELDPDEFGENSAEVARAVRAAWSLTKGPVHNVTHAIEDAGGIVLLSDFGTPLLDAVSRWVPGLPPLFFVNQDAPGDRARLTLAHELGHMVMHRVARPDMEVQAFEFASEFLMPERDIRMQLDGLTLDRLIALKLHWKVSMQALLRRAQDLGRIEPGKARYLWSQIARAGYRTREPVEGDIPREEPRQLAEILRIYREPLAYSPEQLARLLKLNLDELAILYDVQVDTARPRLRLIESAS
jgi:Zn-dependent peptidase ImmA (M78 family)/DNA-binding XRE family transcriptional regulator